MKISVGMSGTLEEVPGCDPQWAPSALDQWWGPPPVVPSPTPPCPDPRHASSWSCVKMEEEGCGEDGSMPENLFRGERTFDIHLRKKELIDGIKRLK